MRLLTLAFVTMALTSSSLPVSHSSGTGKRDLARMAIYYGYPSLVNGSSGDVEKAARTFSAYDVVVWGDGIEFSDRQAGRRPEGDPEEHQKALGIMTAARRHNPGTRFYGYVCLGEIPSAKGESVALTPAELEDRIRWWKGMGVTGIFLDEAGYDYAAITRQRQNLAVGFIHELGLSAFMNAYFVDDLFSLENNPPYAHGSDKNPQHLPPLLDHRDLFLLESFQVKNGDYEGVAAWQKRLTQALACRRRYGSKIFAVTTTRKGQPFASAKFAYALWSAGLYDLDGFGWGEPDFAAGDNLLPARSCDPEDRILPALQASSPVASDNARFWRQAKDFIVVVDTNDHSVRRLPLTGSANAEDRAVELGSAHQGVRLSCGDADE